MKNLLREVFGIFLCAAIFSSEASSVGNRINVATQGVTDVSATLGKNQISAKITTHEIDIGKASDTLPKKRLTSCTYSRFPCSPVDSVEISVNGNSLFVARSVYADLADLIDASLRQNGNGNFLLTLRGGDASESYTIEIMFDKGLVRQRRLIDNLNKQVLQRTTYFTSQTMDE
ncbi:hypothetical protein [Cupriavidus sp. USMAA2-4]|uniref:hypothetical protein n=1 Tax=Cupriavidus sp. USMAA2-4 TaxID=876364 RepID=UPI0012F4BAA0|nr:hypothetical protein [Cupriavidus sp. USMAA2-4]